MILAELNEKAVEEGLQWQALNEETGLPLAIMGLFVVFAALVFVRVFIGTLPRIMAALHHFFPEDQEATHGEAAGAQPASDEIPEAVVAVISAVVADIVGVRHRIVKTRQLTPKDMSWTLEGRLQHHASHRLQPQDRK